MVGHHNRRCWTPAAVAAGTPGWTGADGVRGRGGAQSRRAQSGATTHEISAVSQRRCRARGPDRGSAHHGATTDDAIALGLGVPSRDASIGSAVGCRMFDTRSASAAINGRLSTLRGWQAWGHGPRRRGEWRRAGTDSPVVGEVMHSLMAGMCSRTCGVPSCRSSLRFRRSRTPQPQTTCSPPSSSISPRPGRTSPGSRAFSAHVRCSIRTTNATRCPAVPEGASASCPPAAIQPCAIVR